MTRTLGALLLAAGSLACNAGVSVDQPRSVDEARLKPVECWFHIPSGADISCAHFFPGDEIAGEAVRLPVVRLAGRKGGAHSPILYVPGGPGYPAGLDDQGMSRWSGWQQTARWPHDVVLYDPRGTGEARPRLDCPGLRAGERDRLASAMSVREELRGIAEDARACYRDIGGSEVAQRFSTSAHIDDLSRLLAVLGSDEWNLWGVSYGTRWALQAAPDNTKRVRSLVLDSAYPPAVNGFLTRPAQFQRALEQIAAICRSSSPCADGEPPPARAIMALLRQADDTPLEVELAIPPHGAPQRIALTGFRVLWTLFFESYRAHYDGRIVGRVRDALTGDANKLAPMVRGFADMLLTPDFSYPVYYSVMCAEAWGGVTAEAWHDAVEAAGPLARYFRPMRETSPCRFWKAGELPRRYAGSSDAAVPTLVLAGQRDAATPPEWGRSLAARLPNASFVGLKGSSHAVTFNDSCAMVVAEDFLADPSGWQRPNCLARQGWAPGE